MCNVIQTGKSGNKIVRGIIAYGSIQRKGGITLYSIFILQCLRPGVGIIISSLIVCDEPGFIFSTGRVGPIYGSTTIGTNFGEFAGQRQSPFKLGYHVN